MTDTIETTFDLTPPTQEQFQRLAADLSDEEQPRPPRAWHRSPVLRLVPRRKAPGHFHLPAVRPAAVPWRHQVRERHRLAKLHSAVSRSAPQDYRRFQLRHGPHRDRLRPLRLAPGPCLPRRPAADRRCAIASTRSAWTSPRTASGCPTSSAEALRKVKWRTKLGGLTFSVAKAHIGRATSRKRRFQGALRLLFPSLSDF